MLDKFLKSVLAVPVAALLLVTGAPVAAEAAEEDRYGEFNSRVGMWDGRDDRRAEWRDGWDDRDESGGELFKPAGHAVFDLYYTQRIAERTTFRAGVLNLTDRTYWNWSDIRGLSPTDPVMPYLAQPGRNVSASINFSWQ